MKNKILIFTGVILMAVFMYAMPYTNSSNGISVINTNSSELKLQFKKGIYYEVGKNKPFTGSMRVNYKKDLTTNEGNFITRKPFFENEYVDGVLESTNYYGQNGDFEYSVKNI